MALNIRSLQGHRLMNQHLQAPWERLNQDLETLQPKTLTPKWHIKNLKRVEKYMPADRIKPSEVYHAVFIAFYNESIGCSRTHR